MLVAVEAYARTYDEWPEDGQPVAVSYGVWTTVDDKLQGIEGALRDVARQLGGIRRTLRDAGNVDAALSAFKTEGAGYTRGAIESRL